MLYSSLCFSRVLESALMKKPPSLKGRSDPVFDLLVRPPHKHRLADYLALLRESLSAPQAAPALRLPGYAAYMAALDAQLGRVLSGEITPEAALAAAATDWDRITDRLGRASQRRHYREAMGLGAAP